MNILFVDACPRKESRTRILAEALLESLSGTVSRIHLADTDIPDIDEKAVLLRNKAAQNKDFSDPVFSFAHQFAQADCIVIAAPFWDLSFPAILKKYIEAITVSGVTFEYTEEGIPVGKCQAKNLFYVTTSGGPIFNDTFGYGYIKTLAQSMYGIEKCQCFKAENLDIYGADVDAIMKEAINRCKA